MTDYYCSHAICNRKAEYMINLNIDDLMNAESMNQAGWYCYEHIMEKMDEFSKQVAEMVSENGHE